MLLSARTIELGPGGYDQERTMFSMVKSVWVAPLSLSHIHTVCALIPKIHSLLSNEVTMVLNGGECTWTRICIVLILKIDQKKILHLVVRSIIDKGTDFISTPNIRLMNFYFVTWPSSE